MRNHLKFWFVLLISLCLSAAYASGSIRSENEVKAAFLYNFTRFITWSHTVDGAKALEICVLGNDPFGDLLNAIRGRKSQGRELKLRYSDDPSELSECDVLYISESQSRSLPSLFDLAREEGILTVSDLPDFARKGGMIGYVKQGNVIRFEINLKAASSAGLTINSRLLELAVKVLR
ncbi:YfiR family protein [Marinobacter salsuginis]|uniref:DUF4154 domain-containing protein n=1 Tax=Marinobacter salsuginis TaxID=418719 RepID=A0A5M3PTJ3_9GAMM|nr:YfiR family protein [Marinobacter salsuginis]GBO86255.1 hypothetical protein MS5N3_37060 [Marinobacter salsuginis]